MSKVFVGRLLHGALLLGLGAGTAVAVSQSMAVQQELAALRTKVTQIEKRPTATASPVSAQPVVVLPSGDVVSLPSAPSTEVAELRRRLDELASRMGSSGGATDVSVLPAALSLPTDGSTVALAQLPESAKEALKAVVKETIEERDKEREKERSQEMVTRGSERMLERLAEQLALSESQKAILKGVFDERSKKFAELFTSDMSRDDRRAKMDVMRKEADVAIKQSLTAEQALKYDEISSQMGGDFGGRGGWGGGRGDRGSSGGGSTGGAQPGAQPGGGTGGTGGGSRGGR